MTNDDMALVREYAQNNSEQAFSTLVSRHVNLVYSVALRQTHNPHLAEEITQGVFIVLARKAGSLSPKTILPGWLHRTTRFISADTLKSQRRRQIREQEAHMQPTQNEQNSTAWNCIEPLLDEALGCLGEKEHDAVVLRFFNGKELKHVGEAMGLTEDAARMRVNRGLEKLRKFFSARGVTLSTTAIAGAVAANSVQAAPAGMACTIATAAISGTTITTAAVIAAIKGTTMTTIQTTAIATALAAAIGTGAYQGHQATKARNEVENLRQQQAPLAAKIQSLQLERDKANIRLASASNELALANENASELLRLRGEVTRLRAKTKALETDVKAGEEYQSSVMQITSNTPPVRTLYSTATIQTAWNEPYAFGGWKTPSGKRALVIIQASPLTETNQLHILSSILEYSDDAGEAYGLAKFNTDEQGATKSATLSREQFEALKHSSETATEVHLASELAVTTLSGRQVQIQSIDDRQRNGLDSIIDLYPEISPDGKSVKAVISTHLNYKVQLPQPPKRSEESRD